MNDLPTRQFLEVIIGPMFSGKTTHVIQKYKQHTIANHKVVVMNYIGDTRYSASQLSTHDQMQIECILTKTLTEQERNKEVEEADVVIINEGQFFHDLREFVLDMVENKEKVVYVCGLDCDFERKKFGEILDLIPYCDSIVKLKALCTSCNNTTSALFSWRVSKDTDQVVIGSDNYRPVCRRCYLDVTR